MPVVLCDVVAKLYGADWELDRALSLLLCIYDAPELGPKTHLTHFRNYNNGGHYCSVNNAAVQRATIILSEHRQHQPRSAYDHARRAMMTRVANILSPLLELGYEPAGLSLYLLRETWNHLDWQFFPLNMPDKMPEDTWDFLSYFANRLNAWTEKHGTVPIVQFLLSMLEVHESSFGKYFTLKTIVKQHNQLLDAMRGGSVTAFAYVADRLHWRASNQPLTQMILDAAMAMGHAGACALLSYGHDWQQANYWADKCWDMDPHVAALHAFPTQSLSDKDNVGRVDMMYKDQRRSEIMIGKTDACVRLVDEIIEPQLGENDLIPSAIVLVPRLCDYFRESVIK